MRTLAVVQPEDKHCGILDHANFINAELQKSWRLARITMPEKGEIRAWKKAAADADIADMVLIHFEYGLFHSVKPYKNIFAQFIKALKPPVIVILHDLLPELKYKRSSPKKNKLKNLLRNLLYLPFQASWPRELYNLADHFIVHAPQLRKQLMNMGIQTKVSFLEHPIPSSPQRWSLQHSHKFTFITPGFTKEHKGYLNFLEVLSQHPNWNWCIAGGPQTTQDELFLEQLQAEIQSRELSSRVVLGGYQPREEIDKWLIQADWAVFPYKWTTSSGAVAWAIGLGIPIIATDLDTFKALVQAGAGIVLLPHITPQKWPGLISKFMNNDMQRQLAAKNISFSQVNSYTGFAHKVNDIAMDILYNPQHTGEKD